MPIVINIYYTGTGGSAKKFAEEMISSGIVEAIRNEAGNTRYEYFSPLEDPETILLIDGWENQEALDIHHSSPMMDRISELRDRYDLKMQVYRYVEEETPGEDAKYIRK